MSIQAQRDADPPGAPDDSPPDPAVPDLTGVDPGPVFTRLFDEHAPDLGAYLAVRTGANAEDLLAETFLIAWQRRHTYDPTAGSARGWLFGIAANLVRRGARGRSRGDRAMARLATATAPSASPPDERVAERVDAQVRARSLAGALTELADRDLDVLLLASWAELDLAEIAVALAIPAGTVRSRLHRVRRRLRRSIAAEHPTGRVAERSTDHG